MIKFLEKPKLINIEVTDRCPLECPQCYCKLNVGKDINKNLALNIIRQATELNVEYINISGGETLLYPHLLELINACHRNKIFPNIAISGWGFTELILNKLIYNGINYIFVSLNGSTEKINSFSRNGYNLAINALKILSQFKFDKTVLNWVMQSNNSDDFPNLIKLAEKYNVSTVVIMCIKPNNEGILKNFPSNEQFEKISVFVKKYNGSVNIVIDKCFSQLKAYMGRNIFSNTNIGLYKGCTAGLDSFTLNVDGNFTPCRHLFIPEKFNRLIDYWNTSSTLIELRKNHILKSTTCITCKLKNYCRPCFAVNSSKSFKKNKENTYCQLYLI
ncbi:radical SAM/SPASM domain-containing protein [Clostridium tarantellae]|uniref:Radical SAM protein n=1 Tax=Clostridium tarantellae TaxID=39493 RepID=A0A6I1MUC7_9CLOT|nr:radical SAM protein [Clostridium tarantellae]MPQ43829.1 radical SAM protein [Clostridium tarantellae]